MFSHEQSILEADPSLSREQFIPSTKLKAKIAVFCKKSLEELEGYLQQKPPQEDILQLTAECLSVLSPDAGLENALRVLGAVEGETARRLTGKLRSLVPEEMLIGLMDQLVRELPSNALFLAALIILEPLSERAFEEAFRCFIELLSLAALDAGAFNLAEEVSERLNSSQLSQVNAALGASQREGGDRLNELRLKEAYALLSEGDVEAAICLVNTLQLSPRLEKEVLRFFDETGLSSRKVPILEQRLSAKLEEISRDSSSLADALRILHQLYKAELQSHKPEAVDQSFISLKTELRALHEKAAKSGEEAKRFESFIGQSQKAEAATQQALSSLRGEVLRLNRELAETKHLQQETREALYQFETQGPLVEQLQVLSYEDSLPAFIYSYDTDQLHRTSLVTGEHSSHQVPSYRFKEGCCWSEVPGGSLLITSGGCSRGGSEDRYS
jgi:hypothetical protein